MLKKLFALFKRKKEAAPPRPEHRPTSGPLARQTIHSSQPSSDNPMLNPLHPLNPANPIYFVDDDCRRRSHEPPSSHCSGSSWGGSDSGGSSCSSSSDSGSSCSSSSSSCD
ncbi:hypothetical protein SAMN04244572_04146 [Azotobacter beijerinckii]|uniref:Uncharacterized protein n=1 Tax=Azotobacter beijerinckii TaxID=170623 RepID=A0A1H6ZD50_9GAMM|nr:hypothetical protein [Azotobacter beijerinckii]SEJ47450.1 hypothetical protein SAMN04244572_04146 [Azotobacter beijerinckii]